MVVVYIWWFVASKEGERKERRGEGHASEKERDDGMVVARDGRAKSKSILDIFKTQNKEYYYQTDSER